MKGSSRFLALVLTLALLLSLLTSCKDGTATGEPNGNSGDSIVSPAWDDYGRDRTHFSRFEYIRPNHKKLIATAASIKDMAKDETVSGDKLLERIADFDEEYSSYLSLKAYAGLRVSISSADPSFTEENKLLSVSSPRLVYAIDEMLVALAASSHAEALEDEYFGEGFREKYATPRYTEAVIALMEREAELISTFEALSSATVDITYEGVTSSFDEHKSRLANNYGIGSDKYAEAMRECELLFEAAITERTKDIYVSLLKLRRRIADEYGYASYSEFADDQYLRDYSSEKLWELISGVSEYAVPVYAVLSPALSSYIKSNEAPKASKASIINGTYSALKDISADLGGIYANMLGRGLYNIEEHKLNRSEGAYTTCLYSYEAPFIFMTATGTVSDYLTLSHEFGHFADFFINPSSDASLELLEVSSQGLEFLMLSRLSRELSSAEYKYLMYTEMHGVLLSLISQSFYAAFEQLAYSLTEDEITEERLDSLVRDAAEIMHLNTDYFNDLSHLLIDHLIVAPFYVQSYIPSLAVALDLYFMEEEKEGEGISAYLDLLIREGDGDFEDALENVGLESPFNKRRIMELADKIYYKINGIHYYKEGGIDNAA